MACLTTNILEYTDTMPKCDVPLRTLHPLRAWFKMISSNISCLIQSQSAASMGPIFYSCQALSSLVSSLCTVKLYAERACRVLGVHVNFSVRRCYRSLSEPFLLPAPAHLKCLIYWKNIYTKIDIYIKQLVSPYLQCVFLYTVKRPAL